MVVKREGKRKEWIESRSTEQMDLIKGKRSRIEMEDIVEMVSAHGESHTSRGRSSLRFCKSNIKHQYGRELPTAMLQTRHIQRQILKRSTNTCKEGRYKKL